MASLHGEVRPQHIKIDICGCVRLWHFFVLTDDDGWWASCASICLPYNILSSRSWSWSEIDGSRAAQDTQPPSTNRYATQREQCPHRGTTFPSVIRMMNESDEKKKIQFGVPLHWKMIIALNKIRHINLTTTHIVELWNQKNKILILANLGNSLCANGSAKFWWSMVRRSTDTHWQASYGM